MSQTYTFEATGIRKFGNMKIILMLIFRSSETKIIALSIFNFRPDVKCISKYLKARLISQYSDVFLFDLSNVDIQLHDVSLPMIDEAS